MSKEEMKMQMKRLVAIVVVLLMVVALAACGGGGTTSDAPSNADTGTSSSSNDTATSGGGAKYKIGLSNGYLGNDWRQIMIKVAEVFAEKEPFKSDVEFSIVNTDNTPEAQTQAIDAMIEQGYDAIIIDVSSGEALKPVAQRALDKGIVVVAISAPIEHPDIYYVEIDMAAMSTAWAKYLVEQLEPGAKIAVDTGLPGMTVGTGIYDAAMAVFEANDIQVVAEFAGEWADGKGQTEIASVLAANPVLDGLFSQVYGDTIANAFKQAGRDLIPSSAFITNSGMGTALDLNMSIIIGNNCPGVAAMGLDIAYQALEGKNPQKINSFISDCFVNKKDVGLNLGVPLQAIEEGVNYFPDFPPAFNWPVLPSDYPIQVTAQEIFNYQQ